MPSHAVCICVHGRVDRRIASDEPPIQYQTWSSCLLYISSSCPEGESIPQTGSPQARISKAPLNLLFVNLPGSKGLGWGHCALHGPAEEEPQLLLMPLRVCKIPNPKPLELNVLPSQHAFLRSGPAAYICHEEWVWELWTPCPGHPQLNTNAATSLPASKPGTAEGLIVWGRTRPESTACVKPSESLSQVCSRP